MGRRKNETWPEAYQRQKESIKEWKLNNPNYYNNYHKDNYIRKTPIPEPKVVNNCLNCNKNTYNPKFCNRLCGLKWIAVNVKLKKSKCLDCKNIVIGKIKRCRDCEIIFNLNKNRESQRLLRTRLKKEAIDLLGGKCLICGYKKHTEALEFHHLNPKEKDGNLSSIINQSQRKEELKKCIILCANCHRATHAGLYPQYLIRPCN